MTYDLLLMIQPMELFLLGPNEDSTFAILKNVFNGHLRQQDFAGVWQSTFAKPRVLV